MAQYKAFTNGVEVNGQTVLSVVAGMTSSEFALKMLGNCGIKDPQPYSWYSQQNWLDAFKQIAEKIGPIMLNKIGRLIPEKADWPPFVNSIETALASIDVAYHMNHRLNRKVMFDPKTGSKIEGIGHYNFEKVNEREIKMVCNNPYPCDFDKGIVYATVNKFKPEDVKLISINEEKSNKCRENGGDTCIYTIVW